MGAGVIGVATAFELNRDGHEVTVVDREPAPACFTSRANAGLVAPGHAFAWASPKAPGIMMKSLLTGGQAIRFKPRLSTRQWRWTLGFLRQCKAENWETNTRRKTRLCRYSQTRLDLINDEVDLSYAKRTDGLIYLYRSGKSFEAADKKSGILRDEGIDIRVLSPDELVALDPAMAAAKDGLAGALLAPTDASGDARLFTHELARVCRERGVVFRHGETVRRIELSGGQVAAIDTDKERLTADAYVLALGVYSPHLIEPLGMTLPIYPVKGYSVTLPVGPEHTPPAMGGVDEDNLLAFCPLGDRLRITATAELAGYDNGHRPSDFNDMLGKARTLFPEAADFTKPDYWAGLRPMTPNGMPTIDRSPIENLWFNTGHGHMGWTMAAGAARILADRMAQRRPEIDLPALDYAA
jgi:D-amino-acid dehydrogenase